MPREQLERYCELIAAIKLRTSNTKGGIFHLRKRAGLWRPTR